MKSIKQKQQASEYNRCMLTKSILLDYEKKLDSFSILELKELNRRNNSTEWRRSYKSIGYGELISIMDRSEEYE
jgi:hypothetical protein|tara:strand:+ start:277 stop:498 length:222 start_codon:yes stop_codon:yes gene_type:complete